MELLLGLEGQGLPGLRSTLARPCSPGCAVFTGVHFVSFQSVLLIREIMLQTGISGWDFFGSLNLIVAISVQSQLK